MVIIESVDTLMKEASRVQFVWQKIGGSFQKHLGEALTYADLYNMRKIRNNWLNEWEDALGLYEKVKGAKC